MALLLRRHTRDLVRGGRIAGEHRQLPGIDARRAIFAGLVDPQHRFPVEPLVARLPAHAFLHASAAIAPAPSSEMIAFHPAMEIPTNDHCTWSQRTSGTLIMSSSVAAPVVVQRVMPSHQPSPTPAWNRPIAPEIATASAAMRTSGRVRGELSGENSAPSASNIATPCGQRCQ